MEDIHLAAVLDCPRKSKGIIELFVYPSEETEGHRKTYVLLENQDMDHFGILDGKKERGRSPFTETRMRTRMSARDILGFLSSWSECCLTRQAESDGEVASPRGS